jgi:MoaA/NifB/PqqE/SkfB family radical SAM enzyme
MDSHRLLGLIDEFVESGVFDITLAGGEPLLHPEIFNIVKKATEGGVRIGLLTNGVLLTKENIRNLEHASKGGNFIVQVSIDSLDEKINDYSRGKTKTVAENLEYLRHSSLETQLACVVHRNNYKTAHKLIEHFYPDIKRYHFLNIQRTESSLKYDDLLLTEDEASEFWLRLNDYKDGYPSDLFLPSLRVQMRANGSAAVDPDHTFHQEASFDCASCSAGHTHINVDYQFNVIGCDIAKDYTVMGNVSNKAFKQVWNSKRAHEIRSSRYPLCYEIKDANGKGMKDWLKPEYKSQT